MSRFAHPERTETLDLGTCQCPGQPHDRDGAQVRTDVLSGAAQERIGVYGWAQGGDHFDMAAARSMLIVEGVESWTLLDEIVVDERATVLPVPVTIASAERLDQETRDLIAGWLNARRQAALPNASGARSRASSRASASRDRTRPTAPSSMTSS